VAGSYKKRAYGRKQGNGGTQALEFEFPSGPLGADQGKTRRLLLCLRGLFLFSPCAGN